MQSTSVLSVFAFLLKTMSMYSSCMKSDGCDDPKPSGKCRLTRMTIAEDSGRRRDTAAFIYENDRIVRIDYKDFYKTLVYHNDRVTRVNKYWHDNPAWNEYSEVKYNSLGQMDSIKIRGDVGGTGYAFFYGTDRLLRGTEKYHFGITDFETTISCEYTYSQQNISLMKLENPSVFDFTFTYDNNENYLKKLPPEFIFADDYNSTLALAP